MLTPTIIPDVFNYSPDEGSLISSKGQIAFLRTEKDQIIGFARGFLKLRKNKWWQSLRFHLLLALMGLTFGVIGIILLW